jgi:hypothetical protein
MITEFSIHLSSSYLPLWINLAHLPTENLESQWFKKWARNDSRSLLHRTHNSTTHTQGRFTGLGTCYQVGWDNHLTQFQCVLPISSDITCTACKKHFIFFKVDFWLGIKITILVSPQIQHVHLTLSL